MVIFAACLAYAGNGSKESNPVQAAAEGTATVVKTAAKGVSDAATGNIAKDPLKTAAEDTGAVVETAAKGVADTANVKENEPVTTAVKATAKVATAGVKAVTLQESGEGSED
jgi:hypothetical protein